MTTCWLTSEPPIAPRPAYFPVGDTQALARRLRRLEREPRFVARLGKAPARRAPLFRPVREIAAWRRLLAGLRRPRRRG